MRYLITYYQRRNTYTKSVLLDDNFVTPGFITHLSSFSTFLYVKPPNLAENFCLKITSCLLILQPNPVVSTCVTPGIGIRISSISSHITSLVYRQSLEQIVGFSPHPSPSHPTTTFTSTSTSTKVQYQTRIFKLKNTYKIPSLVFQNRITH